MRLADYLATLPDATLWRMVKHGQHLVRNDRRDPFRDVKVALPTDTPTPEPLTRSVVTITTFDLSKTRG